MTVTKNKTTTPNCIRINSYGSSSAPWFECHSRVPTALTLPEPWSSVNQLDAEFRLMTSNFTWKRSGLQYIKHKCKHNATTFIISMAGNQKVVEKFVCNVQSQSLFCEKQLARWPAKTSRWAQLIWQIYMFLTSINSASVFWSVI